jgi:secreted trypsin-like serine protease
MSTLLLFIGFLFSPVSFISTTTYTCDPSISCGCSAISTVVTSRIVGGELAMNNTWGWMVSLRQSGSPICGASLITSEYALTAGHCVDAGLTDPSQLSILAGTNYLYDTSSTTAQQRTVIKVTRHPNYDGYTYTNDIAILQFSPLTISSTSNIAFICLPNANQDPFQTGSNLVATGWGDTSEGSGISSDYLRQVTVPVVSSTSPNCSSLIKDNSNVEFCAGLDAGGKGKVLILIFSFERCCSCFPRYMSR